MSVTLLAARLVLAAAFAIAGIGKVRDRVGTGRALATFGAPPTSVPLLAVLLPAAELIAAAALLVEPIAWAGATLAGVLLVIFTVAIARKLAVGERPPCNCFGQWGQKPIGSLTLVRNAMLLAIAATVIAYGPGAGVTDLFTRVAALSPVDRAVLLASGGIGALLAVVIGMLAGIAGRQKHVIERLDAIEARLDEAPRGTLAPPDVRPPAKGLPVGTPAPRFALPDLAGQTRTLTEFTLRGYPTLLLFVSPNCTPCAALMPDIRRWQRQHASRFTPILISRDGVDATRAKFGALAAPVLVQAGNEVATAYASAWTPAAVLVGRNGRIASAATYGEDAIRALADEAAADADGDAPRLTRSGSTRAPDVVLPDLDGRPVDLHRDYRGRDTLILFWRPGCSFCQDLVDDVRRWETARTEGDPTLLLISSESPEANRALKLTSTIVLEEDFNAGRAFGVNGTPSAVLVDAAGRLASGVAVGASEILALFGDGRGVRGSVDELAGHTAR